MPIGAGDREWGWFGVVSVKGPSVPSEVAVGHGKVTVTELIWAAVSFVRVKFDEPMEKREKTNEAPEAASPRCGTKGRGSVTAGRAGGPYFTWHEQGSRSLTGRYRRRRSFEGGIFTPHVPGFIKLGRQPFKTTSRGRRLIN